MITRLPALHVPCFELWVFYSVHSYTLGTSMPKETGDMPGIMLRLELVVLCPVSLVFTLSESFNSPELWTNVALNKSTFSTELIICSPANLQNTNRRKISQVIEMITGFISKHDHQFLFSLRLFLGNVVDASTRQTRRLCHCYWGGPQCEGICWESVQTRGHPCSVSTLTRVR